MRKILSTVIVFAFIGECTGAVTWVSPADGDAVTVEENTATGSAFQTLSATASGTISYNILTETPDEDMFNILDTNKLALKNALDYETTQSYILQIKAKDLINDDESDIVLNITVIDVNDVEPEFTSATATDISTNTTVGSVVFTVASSDADSVGTRTYSIISGDDDQDFSINATTGDITLENALNIEYKQNYALGIQVTDGVFNVTQTLNFYVTNVIWTTPSDGETVVVAEDKTINTPITPISADNALVYTFSVDPDERFKFTIQDDALVLKETLEYDHGSTRSYTFTLTALGRSSRTAVITYTVNVSDVNDEPPEIVSEATLDLSKDTNIGDLVYITKATDEDTVGSVTFSIASGNTDSTFSIDETTGELTLENKLDPTKTYSLVLEASDGVVTIPFTLTVTVNERSVSKPEITLRRVASVGSDSTLQCSSTSFTTPSNHSLSMVYSWRVNNEDNPGGTRYSYSDNKNTLTLSNIVKDDANIQFRCHAREDVIGGFISAYSDPFNLDVHYGPDTTNISVPSPHYITEGDKNIKVECSSVCHPGCSYEWTNETDGSSISSSGVFSFQVVDRYMTGDYKCTSHNTAKEYTLSSEKTISVLVQYPTSVTEFSFQDHDRTKTVNETEDVQFICAVDSNPASTIKILFDNGLLEERSNTKRLIYSRRNVACEHTGVYICEGSNSYGQPSRKNVTLIVRCAPRPLQQIQSNTAGKLHDSVTLTFDVIANPEPVPTEYAWHKENTMRWIPLLSNTHLRISSRGLQTNMTILNVSRPDFGQYRVTVTNTVGSYEQYLFLVEEDEQKQQTFPSVKCEIKTDDMGLIVGLCISLLFSVVLFVYATFITFKLKRKSLKKETQSKKEATKQSTYINVAEGDTSRSTNDTSEIQADSVHLYTDLVQYSKDDKTTYDVIQNK